LGTENESRTTEQSSLRPNESIKEMTITNRTIRLSLLSLLAVVMAVTTTPVLLAQSQDRDLGHCVDGGRETFACWNPSAGKQIPESPSTYPEFLPNLNGWDFRINLPHVRFQIARTGLGSPIAMAGVIEDSRPLYRADRPLEFVDYGHRNNAIWLFRSDPADGQVYFAVLPSRVDLSTGRAENVMTLTGAWRRVSTAPEQGFTVDHLGVAVVGTGIGSTTIHLIARGHDGRLHHTQRLVDSSNITQWATPWQDLGATSISPPSVSAAGPNEVALAWVEASRDAQVSVLDTGTGIWTPATRAGREADPHQPRLVWDGTTLNLLFTGSERLRHSYRLAGGTPAFSEPTVVSNFIAVFGGQFDVIAFNNALHIAVRTQTGEPVGTQVLYTTTKTPSGVPSQWTIPSDTGLAAHDAPRIATLYENLFVIATTSSGRLSYARKDPNHVDNRTTDGALVDRWLDAGTVLDPNTTGSLSMVQTLTFNSDLYLTARRTLASGGDSVIVNFGRAAMKHLLTSKWQMTLTYGEPAAHQVSFGTPGEKRMVGDFNGDHRTDIIRFPQSEVAGVGPAPVYVRLVQTGEVPFREETVWHKFFSLKGEIPLVGDFNGDGKDDIITFVQKEQKFANGTPIGPAPVWVSLSDGTTKFNTSRVWHKFFSLKGEIPLVGDFNGDGKDDIITFVQKEQKFANGTPIGPAPVWVALSDAAKFNTSQIWHKFFSLKGEIPLVGDFNGDGKDDIATFVGQLQTNADGTVLGQAPVWVSLSDGTKFEPSRVWHTFFSLKGEFPMVADVNMDGKDDIVTFLRGRGQGLQANNVYVAFSTGSRFERSVMWATNQAGANETAFPGSLTGRSLGDITQQEDDQRRPLRDVYIFDDRGRVRIATALRMIPYPVGAPWERYRFFTEKGIGAASFPEWIYENGPNHCFPSSFWFALLGASGGGHPNFMLSSVRPGGGQGHIMEEQGHALFANCLRAEKDPFGLYQLIYETSMADGGLDASNKPGCDPTFDSCRDNATDAGAEHFFLQLISRYRLDGDEFRARILNGPLQVRTRRHAQYLWVKQHWYQGAEFKRGVQEGVSHYPNGVLCLPGECSLGPIVVPPTDSVTRGLE
jgi:hypothetical protein